MGHVGEVNEKEGPVWGRAASCWDLGRPQRGWGSWWGLGGKCLGVLCPGVLSFALDQQSAWVWAKQGPGATGEEQGESRCIVMAVEVGGERRGQI